MDFSKIDRNDLALQLRKPSGVAGEEVGKVMAQFNADAVTFAIKQLQVQPTDHVLEIGFGPGESIAQLARLTPKGFVAGIDHSQKMHTMASKRNYVAIMKKQVELVVGQADALPYEDGTFDKVLAINVFHFWKTPQRELAECMRVLKPGGRVLFYITHPSSWLQGLKETDIFIAHEPKGAEKILKNAGFQNVGSVESIYKEGKGFVVFGKK